MKVSVIVPVYNVENYLEKCLDSLVKQTLKDIEIIVVNDGSPDDSQKIIDKYVEKYDNVVGYKKKNGGLSDARNYGLKYANGDYISFVDSDDYIDSTMLEKMYLKAKKEKLDIVVCDNIEVYDDKFILKKSNFNYSKDVIKNYIISTPMACCRLYRKSIFDVVKFETGIYYEDLNLNPSLVKNTNKIGFLNEGLYYYVQRNNSIMNQTKFNDKLLDIFKVLANNKKLLFDKYPEEVEYLYITHLLRSAGLRFVDFDNADELLYKVISVIKKEFPSYRKNFYYKKSSMKLKIICSLVYFKQINLLKLLKKVKGN